MSEKNKFYNTILRLLFKVLV